MQVSIPKQLGLYGSTKSVVSSTHKVAHRPRVAVNKSRGLRIRAESDPSEQAMKQTVGGGGYSGTCDIESVKQAITDCEGLEGEALEACWADTGCDVQEVTRHYKSLAGKSLSGLPPQKQEEQVMKQTINGGGFSGVCDINHVKKTLKECAGLEGKALEACWADSGCDVNAVTEHYLSVAGLNKGEFNCFVTHDGHLVSDGLKSGQYNVSAWWSGVAPNADEGKDTSPLSAPACTSNLQSDCTVILTQSGPDSLVCPGLDNGVYQITNIRDFGTENCSFEGGNIECQVEWPEDK